MIKGHSSLLVLQGDEKSFYYSLYKNKNIEMILIANESHLIKASFVNADMNTKGLIKKETVILRQTKTQLDEYFENKRQKFDLPLKFHGTDFQKKVWEQLTKIPYGKLISYQELSEMVEHPKASRAAGSANGKNAFLVIVPCHRVVQKNGTLGGYAGPQGMKEQLVKLETQALVKCQAPFLVAPLTEHGLAPLNLSKH